MPPALEVRSDSVAMTLAGVVNILAYRDCEPLLGRASDDGIQVLLTLRDQWIDHAID